MKYIYVVFLIFVVGACAGLEPISVSATDLSLQPKLVFEESVDKVLKSTKEIIASQGWKLLYEGTTLPKSDASTLSNTSHNPFSSRTMTEDGKSADSRAWDRSLSSTSAPKYFIQVKTPTSAFSYGAEIFITVFEMEKSGSSVSITASTGQALEKEKLEQYIRKFVQSLNDLNH